MSRRASFRLAPALVACLLASLFQACRGSEKTPPPGIPGALPIALDSLSADSLVAFAASLKFVGDTTIARRCDDDPAGCAGNKPAQVARVTVAATEGAYVAGPGKLPANGVIMGRVRSAGHREARYGFKPGAAYEYFLIVMPGADASSATWRIVEVSSVAGQRSRSTVSQGSYTSCPGHSPWKEAPPIPIGFYACERSPHLTDTGVTKSSQMLVDPSLTDPLWTSCSSGCCEASAS